MALLLKAVRRFSRMIRHSQSVLRFDPIVAITITNKVAANATSIRLDSLRRQASWHMDTPPNFVLPF